LAAIWSVFSTLAANTRIPLRTRRDRTEIDLTGSFLRETLIDVDFVATYSTRFWRE